MHKRLQCFENLAQEIDQYVQLSKQEVAALKKGKLGTRFLAQFATFHYVVSEQEAPPSLSLHHIHIGGLLKNEKEVSAQAMNPRAESALLAIEYPMGLHSVLAQKAQEPQEKGDTLREADPSFPKEPIPEVEISMLATIVIDGEEYVFLHNLEKACNLQMDECLGMLSRVISP